MSSFLFAEQQEEPFQAVRNLRCCYIYAGQPFDRCLISLPACVVRLTATISAELTSENHESLR